MNKRIEQLIKQAYVDADHGAGSYFDKEKFAELIIEECFDVVINDGRFHDAKGIIQAGKGVAMEHFGVEE